MSFPIGVMLYVGQNTHQRLNVPNFWPDPERLNNPPKDPIEIKAEIERMRQDRVEKRQRLEDKAKEMNAVAPENNTTNTNE